MTKDILSELEALEAAATSEPWRTHAPLSGDSVQQILAYSGGILAETTHHGKMLDDARLIVSSRNHLKLLIEAIRAGQEWLKKDDAFNVGNIVPCAVKGCELCPAREKYREALGRLGVKA